MIKKIDKILQSLSPDLHKFIKRIFNDFKRKFHQRLSEEEFIHILKVDLGIGEGDTVFVHSSMRSLFLDFSKSKITYILQSLVGENGTLLFPCWQFNTRAEDYINQHPIVFDIKNSTSAMGRLSEVLRHDPKSVRSLHPTNSVLAIGRLANDLTSEHHKDIFPCGIKSPFFMMKAHQAKIIGIGVTVDNLTFVHTVEDTGTEFFPIKTRMDKVYRCLCINELGQEVLVDTLVASKSVSQRDVFGFFKKHVKESEYVYLKRKGMDFFKVESSKLYVELSQLAKNRKTIYGF